jgi:sodium/hydrogen exchanger 10/11
MRQVFKNTRIPYTVSLIVTGLAVGVVSGKVPAVQQYTTMTRINPHLLLYIFMPILMFESAFAMDVHTFRKMSNQILILAFPGLVLASFLCAAMAKFMFEYDWSWRDAMLFGTILSATDPVAVVSLLKELGVSRQIGTIIEGESLMNDGTAIVLFTILLAVIQGEEYTAFQVIVQLIRVAVGGPIFGWIMSKITVGCLAKVFNDAMVEITITVTSSFLTFYIAEAFLGVSGVLAVVVLGLELKHNEAYISPEVEPYLHRFWETLAYLANTVIFVLVGVVISERAFDHVEGQDWFNLIALYFGLTVIRGLVISIFTPCLARLGYGIGWEMIAVMTWGGLRGAVGLILALVVEHSMMDGDEAHKLLGGKILFHCAGIVTLTLLVNATTIRSLLTLLKLNEIPMTKRLAMAHAVQQLEAHAAHTVNVLKEDRFLSDAVWDNVKANCQIVDPYTKPTFPLKTNKVGNRSGAAAKSTKNGGKEEMDNTDGIKSGCVEGDNHDETGTGMTSELSLQSTCCPKCDHTMPHIFRPEELSEIEDDARIRFLKATQRCYWRQYEHGMLGRDAVRVLTSSADHAIDVDFEITTAEDLSEDFTIPKYIMKSRALCDRLMQGRDNKKVPKPIGRVSGVFWKVINRPVFEWIMCAVVLVNMGFIVCEMYFEDGNKDPDPIFSKMNIVFFVIYFVEAVMKLSALRRHYFRSNWNKLDFLILILSLVDVILEASTDSKKKFSPGAIKMVKLLRALRSFRGFRLFKFGVPHIRIFIDRAINRKLWIAYDIGKAYVVAMDEAPTILPQMIKHTAVVRKLLDLSGLERRKMIKTLAELQANHPKIVSSIKTRQASRSILNMARDKVRTFKEDGIMDEADACLLRNMCEKKMKKLETVPPCLDPLEPRYLLRSLVWLEGIHNLDEIVDVLCSHAELLTFQPGSTLGAVGDESAGIFLVVSGMVRCTFKRGDYEFSDFVGVGQVIGEMGVLTGGRRSAEMTSDSIVQVFFIRKEDVFRAFEFRPELQEQLWRVCGVRSAVSSLAGLPLYQNWASQKLKHHCAKGDLVQAEAQSVWNLDDRVSDAVILTGTAVCFFTGQEFGPLSTIHRGVRTLVFTEPTRFLLIPANDTVNLADLPTTMDEVKQARNSGVSPMGHNKGGGSGSSRRVSHTNSLLRPRQQLAAKVTSSYNLSQTCSSGGSNIMSLASSSSILGASGQRSVLQSGPNRVSILQAVSGAIPNSGPRTNTIQSQTIALRQRSSVTKRKNSDQSGSPSTIGSDFCDPDEDFPCSIPPDPPNVFPPSRVLVQVSSACSTMPNSDEEDEEA